jgi:photosystem II stability/assembly factor-like uncharacterized protein
VVGIAIDPGHPKTAFVIDRRHVYRTTNAGAKWTDVTGNLATHAPGRLRSVAYVSRGGGKVVVGTDAGVFGASGPGFFHWERLGSELPNVPVFGLDYSARDDLLLAGTLGRGAWTLKFKNEP